MQKEKNGWNNEKKNSKESNSIKKRDHFPPSKLSTLWEFFLKIDKINLAKGKRKKNDRQKIDGV